MVSDSIANASVPAMASNMKDLAKKKRTNRTAKLKQCKLDARREQWLSQVKNMGNKEEKGGVCESSMHGRNQSKLLLDNLEMTQTGPEIHQDSDLESPSNSPTSNASSVLGSNDSGTNYSGSSSSSTTSRSSSSGGFCSGSITEEEVDDGCLDDWEAVADALAADDKQDNPIMDSSHEHDHVSALESSPELTSLVVSGVDISKPGSGVMVQKVQGNGQAWRPDDAFRPQSLPNLSKHHSFPMNSGRHFGHGAIAWASNSAISAPSSCPICFEDLDITDTSFLPCSCGFRLCLFCHKRILEQDGRCPGCRKQYDQEPVQGEASLEGGSLTFRLARSCSMITRS